MEPRLNSGSSQGNGADGQAQIVGAGVIGPASAEKNCKSVHLTTKQQAICSRSPPVLQVFTSRQGQPLRRINGRGSTRANSIRRPFSQGLPTRRLYTTLSAAFLLPPVPIFRAEFAFSFSFPFGNRKGVLALRFISRTHWALGKKILTIRPF